MEQEKRSQIKKYFKKFPKWAVWMIVIGLPLIPAYGLGLIPIPIGIWGLVTYYQKPTDEQMDAWIQEDLKDLQARALAKTGLDQSELFGEPVNAYRPPFLDIRGAGLGI